MLSIQSLSKRFSRLAVHARTPIGQPGKHPKPILDLQRRKKVVQSAVIHLVSVAEVNANQYSREGRGDDCGVVFVFFFEDGLEVGEEYRYALLVFLLYLALHLFRYH
eukprot:TRINITY_DN3824_c0_g2_i1.p4 TRINITY_DN3824_c0_g2~~TRINITY_DN3824_c0_g2_i1.p4  ORF type:complete len:107 (+),score=3.90 TRINITY_DN3824_c0_g2_i1:1592-1912(+)